MTIREIFIHEHMQKLAQHEEYSALLKSKLGQNLTNAEVHKADVYYMDGDVSNPVLSGHEERLVILLNYPLNTVDEISVRDGEGNIVATYIERRGEVNQINIFPDLFNEMTEENITKFTNILKLIDEQVFLQKILDYSWKSTSKKQELTKEFTQAIIKQQGRFMREDQTKVNRIEEEIRSYTVQIKNNYDTRIRLLNQIEAAKTRLDSVGEKLIKDLDNIVANPKVKELFIKDGKFIVHTHPLYAYHDKNGERYYIGNMRIEMNPQNTEVKFFGDNPRRSHWTSADPHPHVNGRTGEACLGNVASTIAELSSQMELYALTLIGIDFLESVNTSDPAGRNITNWDRVDDEGNILEPEEVESEDNWICPECDDHFSEDVQEYMVYESYSGYIDEPDDATWGEERYVCESCRNDHYEYIDELDAYIRSSGLNIWEREEEEEEDEDEL